MNNTELIKALRYCGAKMGCRDCPLWNKPSDACFQIVIDAADALEANERLLDQNTKRCEALRKQLRESHENYEKHLNELEAQIPKEGEWIYEDLDNFRKYKVTCPHCGAWYIGNYDAYDEPSDFNYCPHCGNICNTANLAWEKELSERERKEQNDAEK